MKADENRQDIGDIDPNLKIAAVNHAEELVFYNIRQEPFEVYGLYQPKAEGAFRRMPEETAARVSPGVERLSRHTAGGRVRFTTDSGRIVIRAVMPSVSHMSHMPLSGSSGFDLYETIEGRSFYLGSFIPPSDMQHGYISEKVLPVAPDGKKHERSLMIHFPLYNEVSSVEIGLEKGSVLKEGAKYMDKKPIVFYGSSITQGGCASRPGNAYSAVISRKWNCDFRNLGFAGNAKGEAVMAEYLSTLPMSVFVCDYDHNAPDAEHLEATLYPLYETIRKKQPDLPYIFVGRPDDIRRSPGRRKVICDAYLRAIGQGDHNVEWIDGGSLFGGEYNDSCTVDGCHPNDLGMIRMADVIGNMIGCVL